MVHRANPIIDSFLRFVALPVPAQGSLAQHVAQVGPPFPSPSHLVRPLRRAGRDRDHVAPALVRVAFHHHRADTNRRRTAGLDAVRVAPVAKRKPTPDAPPPRRPLRRAAMVRWNELRALAQTGLSAGMSAVFEHFADKRETQGGLPPDEFSYDKPTDLGADGSFWLDFVSDAGDGFDSTYTVAWLLAQSRLRLSGAAPSTTRSAAGCSCSAAIRCIPAASWARYQERFRGPVHGGAAIRARRVRRICSRSRATTTGTTASRASCGCSASSTGSADGRRSRTDRISRSACPGDGGYGGSTSSWTPTSTSRSSPTSSDIATKQMAEGDRVILVTSKPSWTKAENEAGAAVLEDTDVLRGDDDQAARRHGGACGHRRSPSLLSLREGRDGGRAATSRDVGRGRRLPLRDALDAGED